MLIIGNSEARIIDSYAPQTDIVAPRVVQLDTPDHNLTALPVFTTPPLPDPTVGGRTGSRVWNGFNTGLAGFWQSRGRMTGAVAKLPAVRNPAQGNVGRGARETVAYRGVMSQLVNYSADRSRMAAQIVGPAGKRGA